jgi:hypothetical protein
LSTFLYTDDCKVLHEAQRHLLCSLLEFIWSKTTKSELSTDHANHRVDLRLALTDEQFLTVLGSLDSFFKVGTKYKSTAILRKLQIAFRNVPGANNLLPGGGSKIALRMTRGPTNTCINFHCDGSYATSTSQIALNATSEYDGGKLCFFTTVNNNMKVLHVVPRTPGSMVQHPPNILHDVTSVTRGTRKSLFVVDKQNGLGQAGVVVLSWVDVESFLAFWRRLSERSQTLRHH